MEKRTFNPDATACSQWERVFADALDGLLRPEDEAAFKAHLANCATCAALYEEARQGHEWLGFLAEEPELPAGLLNRILAKTGPGQVAGSGLAVNGALIPIATVVIPAWQRPGFTGQLRRYAEPRLLMTAAMAFFSFALTLNLTGIRLSDLRPAALRSLMERRLTMASTPIVRYYDHSLLVYEVESRVRELRQATRDEENQRLAKPTPGESRQQRNIEPGQSQPRQSATPAKNTASGDSEILESSLSIQRIGGSQAAEQERKTA